MSPSTLRALVLLALCGLLGAGCRDAIDARPVAEVVVTASRTDLGEEESVQLTAVARDDRGREIPDASVLWTSSDESVAVVDASGLVHALAPGTATIRATVDGVHGAVVITVAESPVGSVLLGPDTLRILAGVIGRLSLAVRDERGRTLTDREVIWSTPDSAILRFRGGTTVQGLEPGTGRVRATVGGVTAETHVQVLAPARSVVWPDTSVLLPGITRRLHLEGFTGSNRGRYLVDGARWTSDDPSIASVDSLGVVTPHATGTVRIRGELGALSGEATVHVVRYEQPLRFRQIASSFTHSCGVTESGDAFCWGSAGWAANYRGEFGSLGPLDRCYRISTTASRTPELTFDPRSCAFIPARVAGGAWYAQVAVGERHSCGLTADGRALCWGEAGLLGDGAVRSSTTPVEVAGGLGFQSIAASGTRTCGITEAGEAYCWGDGFAGGLGDGGETSSSVPIRVASDRRLAQVSVGGGHACALDVDGAAYCWGSDLYGQLGVGGAAERCGFSQHLPCARAPHEVAGGLRFQQIGAGARFTCGLDSSGRAHCWGGRMGEGAVDTSVPRAVPGGDVFQQIAVGDDLACGITAGGIALCWGSPEVGGSRYLQPTPLLGDLRLREIFTGASCGLGIDGVTYCWRRARGDGQDAYFGPPLEPAAVAGQR